MATLITDLYDYFTLDSLILAGILVAVVVAVCASLFLRRK